MCVVLLFVLAAAVSVLVFDRLGLSVDDVNFFAYPPEGAGIFPVGEAN
jgi:hypothetical protein